MASARSIITTSKKSTKKRFRRMGKVSGTEKVLIQQFVADAGGDVTSQMIGSLANAMRRSKDSIKGLVEEAKEQFAGSAKTYVDIHMQATQSALANGDPKSLEVATRGAQWAIEHIEADGVRVVNKASAESTGTKIMIGVKLGGLNEGVVKEGVIIKAEQVE